MAATIHHPKGSMCANCRQKLSRDCTKLDFSKMKPIKQYSEANDPTIFKVVICSAYKASKQSD